MQQSKLVCLSIVRKCLQVVQGASLRLEHLVGTKPPYNCKALGEKPITLVHLYSSLLLQSKLVCLSIVRKYLYIEQGASFRVKHLAGTNPTDNCKAAGDNPIKFVYLN